MGNSQRFFVPATTAVQKMKFSIKDFFSKCDQITFTAGILNGKLHFLCSEPARFDMIIPRYLSLTINEIKQRLTLSWRRSLSYRYQSLSAMILSLWKSAFSNLIVFCSNIIFFPLLMQETQKWPLMQSLEITVNAKFSRVSW